MYQNLVGEGGAGDRRRFWHRSHSGMLRSRDPMRHCGFLIHLDLGHGIGRGLLPMRNRRRLWR
ncbi:hypothetical protein ACS0TY_014850 [Phlomoides rotata]